MKTDFQFSQSSLQDFVDCQKRFELRYIKKLKWPALQFADVEEYEKRSELGSRFHKLIHQYNLGLPEEILRKFINDPKLEIWWKNFLNSKLISNLPQNRNSEFTLSAEFESSRLMAKYDMLVVKDGEFLILDWKTTQSIPKRFNLERRIQSKLYPFLLVLAGGQINHSKPPDPAHIRMIYWFTEFPDQTQEFIYSAALFEEDKVFFSHLVSDILQAEEWSFQRTNDERLCRFCNFRSYCNRGISAGSLAEETNSSDQAPDLDLNLDLDMDMDLDLNIESII